MNKKQTRGQIDWMITLLPLGIVVTLCVLFFFAPEQSNAVLGRIRFFFGDTLGTYYLVSGLGIFLLSIYIAASKYVSIVLGEPGEKPKYSFFAWGCMMFTCGLAADILFYSFSEWVLYASDPHIAELGSVQDWAGVFPLFHWSFIPWGFYLVLAVAFGFMLHVRKCSRQKYSEACRPILGRHTDGLAGRIIDLLAVFALLAGTATTFSVATPLMAAILGDLLHFTVSQTAVNIVSGLVVIFFGLNVLGVFQLNLFRGSSRSVNTDNMGFFSAMLFGVIFSLGWTPCVGAFLGSALMLASQQGHVLEGMLMLLTYSLGLGIPFVLSAVLIDYLKSAFQWIKKNYRVINLISGSLLVVIGVLMATGTLGRLLSLMS